MEDIKISVEQMRKSDAYTIENFVPSKELMYRAANGVFDSFRDWDNKKIAIVVGGGNNGGDGYALAGILKKNNIDSTLIKVSEKMSEDGKYYSDIAEELGVKAEMFTESTDLSSYEVIVDCILGTGFTGEVRGLAKDAIEAITANSRDSDSKYLESERIILESDAIEALTILPSVKPERNLCRECKFVVYHGSVDKNGNVESCWYCRNWDGGTDEEGFCHEWERK